MHIRIALLTIILILLLPLIFLLFLRDYLTHNSSIPANTLIVEGWIPDYGIRRAYEEYSNGNYDYLIVTGNRLQDHIILYINSYLIFFPDESIASDSISRGHLFEIYASSTLGVRDSAHFVFWVNNERIDDYYTTEKRGRYRIPWTGNLSSIDSLMIQFDNDKVSEKGDRNLSIDKFTLNGINLLFENTDMFRDTGRPFGRFRWNASGNSFAEISAQRFIHMGINRNKVIAVPNEYFNLRRTHGNALALKNWLTENELQIEGLNIVSMDYHSRRTWLTYRKLLSEYGEVGIISAENVPLEHSRKKKYKNVLRESIAMVYYWIFILPWI